MSLAFTPNGPQTTTIALPPSNDGGVALIGGLDPFVQSCGWVRTGTYGSGFEYLITSPQGLQARCRIYPSSASTVAVQMLSADSVRVGLPETLLCRQAGNVGTPPVPALTVWGDVCQLFTSAPIPLGYGLGDLMLRAVQCGIPYTAEGSEIWFSTSDNAQYVQVSGFRQTCFYPTSAHFSVCYNGTLRTGSGTSPDYARGLRLAYPLIPVVEPSNRFFPSGVSWFADVVSLKCDPLVAWASSASSPVREYGQLWDAVIAMETPIADTVCQFGDVDGDGLDDIDWIAYSDTRSNYDWGHTASLWLLKAVPPVTGGAKYFAY